MSITSYAQNFEDIMLWRALQHVSNGFYIDVGAQDPVIDSVSLLFYEQGWRGVHVEPSSHFAQLLRESRPDETVIQAAVSESGSIVKFYEIADSGLSTCDPEVAERHRASAFEVNEVSVPCITLLNIFELCGDREIQWLKIDVEGIERQVLLGWGQSPMRPWVVVIESTLPLTQIESHEKWEELLLRLEYQFVYFDGLNRYYLSKAHSELEFAFHSGPNIFDGFVLSGTSSAPFCTLLNNKISICEQALSTQIAKGEAEIRRLNIALSDREQDLNAQITQSQTEVQRLRMELARREKDLNAQLADVQSEALHLTKVISVRVHELGAQFSEIYARLSTQTEGSTVSKTAAHLQTNELNAANAKISELNQHSHHWWMEADRLNLELQAVYGSYSWRFTAPLRRANFLKRQCKQKVTAGISIMGGIPSRIVRFLMRRALTYVNTRPRIRTALLEMLAHFPKAMSYLRVLRSEDMRVSMPIAFFKRNVKFKQDTSEALIHPQVKVEANSLRGGNADIREELHRAVSVWRLGSRVDE